MVLEHGDMWSVFGETDLFCITTNSFIRKDGQLVMGRGIALAVKKRVPNIAKMLGDRINHLRDYGLVILKRRPLQSLAAFQVKRYFKDVASLELIKMSAKQLASLADEYPNARFDLNFPGIGAGSLKREEVLPIIERLPDNVHVWDFSK